LFVSVALLASACGEASYEGSSGDFTSTSSTPSREDALEDARADLDGTSYQDNFGNLDCTQDCSGHDAGYEWAQDNEIEDEADCGGNSWSFEDGCRAYAEELESRTADYLEE